MKYIIFQTEKNRIVPVVFSEYVEFTAVRGPVTSTIVSAGFCSLSGTHGVIVFNDRSEELGVGPGIMDDQYIAGMLEDSLLRSSYKSTRKSKFVKWLISLIVR